MSLKKVMSPQEASNALAMFGHVPGIGQRMAEDLWHLGLRSMQELRESDPELMYREICHHAGGHVDRCVLYVYRCAVAYARNPQLDPEMCKWWNWKGRTA